MAFDEEDWKRRLGKAQTQEEFSALIMELPERGSPETKKESEEDGREFYLLEARTTVRCYDERDVYFYVPFYDKVGKDRINGIQITTMFLGMDYRCFEGQTHWFGKDGPLLFETKIYATMRGVEMKYAGMFCSTYEEAEQMHQQAVERIRTTPLEELAYIYSHIQTLEGIKQRFDKETAQRCGEASIEKEGDDNKDTVMSRSRNTTILTQHSHVADRVQRFIA